MIRGLTVLRGAAALAVLSFHVALLAADTRGTAVAVPFNHGWAGVDLFFALSAFLLALPLVGERGHLSSRGFWAGYLRRRALRIAPPYYASIVLSLVLGGALLYFVSGWGDVALHLLFLHGFVPGSYTSINPVYWTLAIEMQFYLLLPLLVWLLDRPSGWLVALGFGVLSAALRFGAFGTNVSFLVVQLPGFLAPFAAGVVAARLHVRGSVAPRLRVAVGVAALVLLLGVLAFIPAGSVLQAMESRALSTFGRPLIGVAFAALILAVASDGPRSGRASWPARLASWPGEVSYSLYLVHVPVLLWFAAGPGARWTGHVLFVPALVIVALVAAAAFHAVFERPWLRRRAGARGTTQRPPMPAPLTVSRGNLDAAPPPP